MLALELLNAALTGITRFFPTTSLRVADTGHCHDVHLFMRCSYEFWVYGGVWPAVVSRLVDALNCIVVWLFVFFMAFVIDWDELLNCSDHCGPLFQSPSMSHTPGGHTIFAVIFLLSATAAFLIEVSRSIQTYFLLSEIHVLLSDVMDCGYVTPFHSLVAFWYQWREGYAAVRLEAVGTSAAAYESVDGGEPNSSASSLLLADHSWAAFLAKLCAVVRDKKSSLGIVESKKFDELRAVQVLMIYDNFLISMHHHRVFQGCALQYVDDSIVKFLLTSLFDDYNAFDPGRAQDEVIRSKLFWYLVAYWTLYPFLISFFLVKMVVRNVALIKTRPSEYLERNWSPDAIWRFRLMNEVVHVVAERCRAGQELASTMSSKLQHPSEWYRFIERMASTVVLTIVVMSVVNTTALTSGVLAGRTLVWWLSTAIVIHSVVHRPDPSSGGGRANAAHRLEYFHDEDLTKLVHLLHYDEPDWYTSGSRWVSAIQWDFFHTRLYLLVAAILRTLVMPLVLLRVYFDDSLNHMIAFLHAHSSRVNCVGTVAVEADFRMEGAENLTPRGGPRLFDPSAVLHYYGEMLESSNRPSEAVEEREEGEEGHQQAVAEGAADGSGFALSLEMKKEKSIASFAAIYPAWRKRAMDDNTLGIATFLSTLQQDPAVAAAVPVAATASATPPLRPAGGAAAVPPLNLRGATATNNTTAAATSLGSSIPTTQRRQQRTATEAQHLTVSRLDDALVASRRFYAEQQHQQNRTTRSQASLRQAGGRYGGMDNSVEMEDR